MAFSQSEPINIHSLLNEDIKVVNNFKYLGAWMSSSSKDFEIRKALAWQACHKLKKLWNSKLKRKLKIRTFQATIKVSYYMAVRLGRSTNHLNGE